MKVKISEYAWNYLEFLGCLSKLYMLFVSMQNKRIINFFVLNNSKAEAALKEVSTTTKCT